MTWWKLSYTADLCTSRAFRFCVHLCERVHSQRPRDTPSVGLTQLPLVTSADGEYDLPDVLKRKTPNNCLVTVLIACCNYLNDFQGVGRRRDSNSGARS